MTVHVFRTNVSSSRSISYKGCGIFRGRVSYGVFIGDKTGGSDVYKMN